jgi:hypothetical protein
MTEASMTVPVSARPRRAFWSRPRPWIWLAVTLTWIGFVWLAWRHEHFNGGAGLRRMGLAREVVLAKWADVDQWTAIEHEGRWIGASRLTIRSVAGESSGGGAGARDSGASSIAGFDLFARTRMSFSMMGVGVPVDVQARARLSLDFELQSLVATLRLAGQDFHVEGFVEDGMLDYHAWADGGSGTKPSGSFLTLPSGGACGSAPLAGPIVLDSVVMPILGRADAFKPGARWATQVSNPIFGQMNVPVEIKVVGRESVTIDGRPRQAWRVSERFGDMTATAWQDEMGQTLREELNNGLTMTLSGPRSVLAREPQMRQDLPMNAEPDRAWIRAHQDPALKGKPLPTLAKSIPGM